MRRIPGETVRRFADQVNSVQADLAGATRTILFTTGDGPKPLSRPSA